MPTPQFSDAQRAILREMWPYEDLQINPIGEVTISISEGGARQLIRISRQGVITRRVSTGDISIKSARPSLNDKLTEGVKTTRQIKPLPPPFSKREEIKAPPIFIKPYSSATICQEQPEYCSPREIKHVAFDADHTIWDLDGTAASVTGKLKRLDDNTVVEINKGWEVEPRYRVLKEKDLSPEERSLLEGLSADEKDFLLEELSKERSRHPQSETKKPYGATIKLFPTFRQTLDELDKRGISSSIISLNTPGSVKRILREFGLENRFVEIRDSYENKGKVFREIPSKLKICPCDAIFVDDTRANVQDVVDSCGMGLQIGPGKEYYGTNRGTEIH